MNFFKVTTWKWWELKFLVVTGLFFGFALGTHLGIYIANWLWLVWAVFIVLWIYVVMIWLKK